VQPWFGGQNILQPGPVIRKSSLWETLGREQHIFVLDSVERSRARGTMPVESFIIVANEPFPINERSSDVSENVETPNSQLA
jgi:hypothetical protein